MHVVAIAELRGEREAAALALAPVLGTLAYEIRSRLGATLPVIVYRSGDAIEAAKVLMEIQRLGHGALALDTGAMGPALEPLRVHGFEWDDAAAYAVGPSARQALPWSAVGAVVMMQVKGEIDREHKQVEMVGVGGRYRAPVRTVVTSVEHDTTREQLALLYPIGRTTTPTEPPWLLHEHDLRPLALGDRMRATHRENFLEFVAIIRAHATGAIFDDRFVRAPMSRERATVRQGGHEPERANLLDDVALRAALLAQWLQRAGGGPYRAPLRP